MNRLIPSTNVDVNSVISIAKKAGEKIINIYNRNYEITEKKDKSPVTEADMQSNNLICDELRTLAPNIPILSEESTEDETAKRIDWNRYWLIDPLDGTKEFINKNDEFTVNIALIEHNLPIFGVVYAPALQDLYWGGKGLGAYKVENESTKKIRVRNRPSKESDWKVIGSRSHQTDEFIEFMKDYPTASIISMGSSLKLCLIAEGLADLYPRLGPTSEWDTAASQAIVEAAGGLVLNFHDMEPIRYNLNPGSLLNPHFLVCAKKL